MSERQRDREREKLTSLVLGVYEFERGFQNQVVSMVGGRRTAWQMDFRNRIFQVDNFDQLNIIRTLEILFAFGMRVAV